MALFLHPRPSFFEIVGFDDAGPIGINQALVFTLECRATTFEALLFLLFVCSVARLLVLLMMRGQMSSVLKLIYNRAVHWFKEFHDKMGLPAFDIDRELIDHPGRRFGVWKFEITPRPLWGSHTCASISSPGRTQLKQAVLFRGEYSSEKAQLLDLLTGSQLREAVKQHLDGLSSKTF